MAFSGNFMCTSFKKELLEGGHDFKNSGGDTFKIALIRQTTLRSPQLLQTTQLQTK